MGTLAKKLEYLKGSKAAIKQAIINKGVSVADTDTFRSYADKIGTIKTGGNLQAKTQTITTNTTTTIKPDSGYDGLSSVSVTTNVAPTITQTSYTKALTINTAVTSFTYSPNNTAIKFALIITYEIGNTGATASSTITITLQGSQNNSSWTTINSFTKKRDSHSIAPCNKLWNNITGYKYYRVRVSSTDNETYVNCVNYRIS